MLKKINYCLVSISVFIALFILAINFSAFNLDFYKNQYTKLSVDQVIGASIDDLLLVSDNLLNYVKGNNDELQTYVLINDQSQPFYNQKEIDHMVDVKNLYLSVQFLLYTLLTYVFINAIYITYKKDFKLFSKIYFKSLLYFVIVMITLVFVCVLDFDSMWRLFHKIFFTNELWLLNPLTDNLINLVPLEFFIALVSSIIFKYFLMILVFSSMIYMLKGVKKC